MSVITRRTGHRLVVSPQLLWRRSALCGTKLLPGAHMNRRPELLGSHCGESRQDAPTPAADTHVSTAHKGLGSHAWPGLLQLGLTCPSRMLPPSCPAKPARWPVPAAGQAVGTPLPALS